MLGIRHPLLAWTFAAGIIFALIAAPVHAQLSTHPAVKRYNRVARGKDVDEWQRRLTDPDAKTRLEATTSLATEGGTKAVKPLVEAMADPDERIRIRAIDGLGLIGDPGGSAALMQLLFLNDVSKNEKLRVLTALGRIKDPDTAERLLSYAQTVPDEELSCRAIFAVGEVGNPETRSGLENIEASSDSPHVARLCRDALDKIDLAIASAPRRQPTILELEKRLAPPNPDDQ